MPGHIGYGELIRIAEIERGIEPNHVPRHQRRHDENGGNDYRQRRAQRLQRLDAACAQTGAQRANLRPEQGKRKQCGQGERRSASEIRRNAQGAQGQSWQGERLGIARCHRSDGLSGRRDVSAPSHSHSPSDVNVSDAANGI